MSKLRDLLGTRTNTSANAPTTSTTAPAAGNGTNLGIPPAQQSRVPNTDAKPAAGASPHANPLNQRLGATAGTSEALGSATPLADIKLQITTDVTDWPDQDPDADMSEPANQLRAHLHTLAQSLNTEDVSDAMMRVYKFLDENPNMKDILLPEDIQLCIKALQQSTNTTIAKKQERKQTRSKRTEAVENLAGELADLGFG